VSNAATTTTGRGSGEAGNGKEAEHRKGATTASGSTVKEAGEDVASHREGGGGNVLDSVMTPRQELRAQVMGGGGIFVGVCDTGGRLGGHIWIRRVFVGPPLLVVA
jgi:hypothetical protein